MYNLHVSPFPPGHNDDDLWLLQIVAWPSKAILAVSNLISQLWLLGTTGIILQCFSNPYPLEDTFDLIDIEKNVQLKYLEILYVQPLVASVSWWKSDGSIII